MLLQDSAGAHGLNASAMMEELEKGTQLELDPRDKSAKTDEKTSLNCIIKISTEREGRISHIPGLDLSPTKVSM